MARIDERDRKHIRQDGGTYWKDSDGSIRAAHNGDPDVMKRAGLVATDEKGTPVGTTMVPIVRNGQTVGHVGMTGDNANSEVNIGSGKPDPKDYLSEAQRNSGPSTSDERRISKSAVNAWRLGQQQRMETFQKTPSWEKDNANVPLAMRNVGSIQQQMRTRAFFDDQARRNAMSEANVGLIGAQAGKLKSEAGLVDAQARSEGMRGDFEYGEQAQKIRGETADANNAKTRSEAGLFDARAGSEKMRGEFEYGEGAQAIRKDKAAAENAETAARTGNINAKTARQTAETQDYASDEATANRRARESADIGEANSRSAVNNATAQEKTAGAGLIAEKSKTEAELRPGMVKAQDAANAHTAAQTEAFKLESDFNHGEQARTIRGQTADADNALKKSQAGLYDEQGKAIGAKTAQQIAETQDYTSDEATANRRDREEAETHEINSRGHLNGANEALLREQARAVGPESTARVNAINAQAARERYATMQPAEKSFLTGKGIAPENQGKVQLGLERMAQQYEDRDLPENPDEDETIKTIAKSMGLAPAEAKRLFEEKRRQDAAARGGTSGNAGGIVLED